MISLRQSVYTVSSLFNIRMIASIDLTISDFYFINMKGGTSFPLSGKMME